MLSIHLKRTNLLKVELDIKTIQDSLEWKADIFHFANVTINHLDLPQSHSCCPTSSEMDWSGHAFFIKCKSAQWICYLLRKSNEQKKAKLFLLITCYSP